MKHTKGEWKAIKIKYVTEGGNYYIKNELKNMFVTVWGITEESEANAKLIAAAPELLEDLIEMRNLMQDIIDGQYKPDSFTLQSVNKTIKKATP